MVQLSRMYEGPAPKPGLTLPKVAAKPKPAPKPVVKVTPKPVLPGHEAGPKKVGKANPSVTNYLTAHAVTVTPKPVLPGHEAVTKAPAVTKAKTVAKVTAAPVSKPVTVVKAPARTTTTKNVASTPAKSTSTAANSPAPVASTVTGGGLSSLLPLLLIAGAVLAGIYLYSHRKGK